MKLQVDAINAKLKGAVTRGISEAEIDSDGHLILTLTDESEVDLGVVVGTGIEDVEFKETLENGDNVYTINLTDDTSYDFTAPKGDQGVSISSVTYDRTDSDGNNIYTVNLSNGTSYEITSTKGDKGDKGDTGNGIASVELTAGTHAEGTLDTYTITYTDGSVKTFMVYNGADGNAIANIQAISSTHAAGTYDTYRINMTDGSAFDFQIYNGANGEGSGDMLASVYDAKKKSAQIATEAELTAHNSSSEAHADIREAIDNIGDNLATVATSGSYNDLQDKPTLFSGSYNDLSDTPTLGTSSSLDTTSTVSSTSNKVPTAKAVYNYAQPKLTFDSTPTADSSNPVTSGGIKSYVDNATPKTPNHNFLKNAWFAESIVGKFVPQGTDLYTDSALTTFAVNSYWDLPVDAITSTYARAIDITWQGDYCYANSSNLVDGYIEVLDKDYSEQTMTFSVKLADGTVKSAIITTNEYVSLDDNIQAKLVKTNTSKYYLVVKADMTTIEAIKLELGSVSTLAYETADSYTADWEWHEDNFGFQVGDILTTARTDLSDDWALCNGQLLDGDKYEASADYLPATLLELVNSNTLSYTSSSKFAKNDEYIVFPITYVYTNTYNSSQTYYVGYMWYEIATNTYGVVNCMSSISACSSSSGISHLGAYYLNGKFVLVYSSYYYPYYNVYALMGDNPKALTVTKVVYQDVQNNRNASNVIYQDGYYYIEVGVTITNVNTSKLCRIADSAIADNATWSYVTMNDSSSEFKYAKGIAYDSVNDYILAFLQISYSSYTMVLNIHKASDLSYVKQITLRASNTTNVDVDYVTSSSKYCYFYMRDGDTYNIKRYNFATSEIETIATFNSSVSVKMLKYANIIYYAMYSGTNIYLYIIQDDVIKTYTYTMSFTIGIVALTARSNNDIYLHCTYTADSVAKDYCMVFRNGTLYKLGTSDVASASLFDATPNNALALSGTSIYLYELVQTLKTPTISVDGAYTYIKAK